MTSDLAIAQATRLRPIVEVAQERLGIAADHLVPFGHYKAKLALPFVEALQTDATRREGRLVLVTAMSPTPAGEGKTTTTVGLGDALWARGRRTLVCLREPSIGPVFGMKGGAAGGGRAQVVPMEDINLHFTGDFAAIALAHNLLAALIDNHVHHGNALDIDLRRVGWRRVMDLNDRALRHIGVGLGGPGNGFAREDGFDIVAASEVMAILCLANGIADLKARLARIVVAQSRSGRAVTAADVGAVGAMAVLLKDALAPNLVQTLEHNPALIHGGPFANIAHGCNSLLATRSALKLADWVVTEAGFGADLGAEKFIDIKARIGGLRPAAAVLVVTLRALKYHGGLDRGEWAREDAAALQRGCANLDRHLNHLREVFGLRTVVALNHREGDAAGEIEALQRHLSALGAPFAVARHWAEGGRGATPLADAVLDTAASEPPPLRFAYENSLPLWDKLRSVAQQVYGAADIDASAAVRRQVQALQEAGHGSLPVCVAKTQYSFSTDPKLRGAPSGHRIVLREVRLAAGAGFVVMICGEVLTMPGLPVEPAALGMDVEEQGRITGLD
jgi:formate--tetrahydrofolate ligase